MLELGRLVHRDAVARVRDVPAFDHRAADEQHTHNEEHDARRELAQPHGKRKREHDHARTESKNEHQGPEHGASEKSKRMWARTVHATDHKLYGGRCKGKGSSRAWWTASEMVIAPRQRHQRARSNSRRRVGLVCS